MRKYVLYLMAGLALAGCRRMEMEAVIAPQQEESRQQAWTVTVQASHAGEPEPDNKGLFLEDGTLYSQWSHYDEVQAYNQTGSFMGTLLPSKANMGTCILSGTLSFFSTPLMGEPVTLYFIRRPADEGTYAGQKGTLEDIARNYDYATAQVQVKSVGSEVLLTDAHFVRNQSITHFTFLLNGDTSGDRIRKLVITSGGLDGPVTVEPETAALSFYVAIPSREGATERIAYSFTAETANGAVYSGTLRALLENGKYYVVPTARTLTRYESAKQPLTLEALQDGTVTVKNPLNRTLYYGFEGQNNNAINSNIASGTLIEIPVKAGDRLLLGGYLTTGDRNWSSDSDYASIRCDVPHYVYGNVMSLIDYQAYKAPEQNPFINTAESFAFRNLFSGDDTWEGRVYNSTLYNHPVKDIELPATTVKTGAYAMMFTYCDNLSRAPELPATTLTGGPWWVMADSLSPYYYMFGQCKKLKTGPSILPALSVPDCAYARMFERCSSLEASPVLPSQSPATQAYWDMFWGCTSLRQITCYAKTNLGESGATRRWVEGVPGGGMFIQDPSVTWPSGDHGIPAGWNGYVEPFTIEAIQDGTITISNPQALQITYGKDVSIASATTSANTVISIPVSAGDQVRLWADNPVYGHEANPSLYTRISADTPHYMYGDLRSLVSRGDYPNVTTAQPYAFREMFFGNTQLRTHPAKSLNLGFTTLGTLCFGGLFHGCTGISGAPALPATTLAEFCYEGMFSDCSSLVNAPALPVTNLAQGCYQGMFSSCTSLVTAPALPATTLVEDCYMNMFDNCTALKNAPVLNASTLVRNCYSYMFRDCTSLQSVTCLAVNPTVSDYGADPPVEGSVDEWLENVAANGTFTQKSGVTWPAGTLPPTWSVVQQ